MLQFKCIVHKASANEIAICDFAIQTPRHILKVALETPAD